MNKLTPNQIQIAVNKIGYDVFPKRQENGIFRMEVWLGNEICYGLGKTDYKCWKKGSEKTYLDFYNKYVLNKK